MRAIAAVCLAGCAYHPGSFTRYGEPFDGQRVTAGCLDLSIERRQDLEAVDAVISYQFGNRCTDPAIVDLANAHVVGRTREGQEVPLAPYDPKHEVRALELDGRWTGKEVLAYESQVALVQVCVDAASIAHRPDAQWICFGGDHL